MRSFISFMRKGVHFLTYDHSPIFFQKSNKCLTFKHFSKSRAFFQRDQQLARFWYVFRLCTLNNDFIFHLILSPWRSLNSLPLDIALNSTEIYSISNYLPSFSTMSFLTEICGRISRNAHILRVSVEELLLPKVLYLLHYPPNGIT